MKTSFALLCGALCASLPVAAAELATPGVAAPHSVERPVWPVGIGRYFMGADQRPRIGSIEVEYTVGPDGAVYLANTARLKLPKSKRKPIPKFGLLEDFEVEAIRAMLLWRYSVPADLCGVVTGKQSFDFDGTQEVPGAPGAAGGAKLESLGAVDQMLEPITVAGSVVDPALGDSRSLARLPPFRVMDPLQVRARVPPLPPSSAPSPDLEPAKLESWSIDTLVAATDPRKYRQLALARFNIGADGKVSGIDVDQRVGEDDFGEAVAVLLKGASFTPARRAGAPVAVKACQAFGSVVFARAPAINY